MFCHNTSRVKDEKYPTLLRDKGGSGFPTLAFMSPDGAVLAKPRTRTVACFDRTHAALQGYDALKKKAKGGDGQAQIELFLADLELGKIGHMQAVARLERLPQRSAAQAKQIDGFLINWELAKMFRGRNRASAAGKVAKMFESGRIPEGGRWERSYWYGLLQHADKTENATLYGKALDKIKAMQFGRYEKRLAELKHKQNG